MARAATRRGYSCVVFAAERANPVKVEAMKRLGADVRLVGVDFDAAKSAARAYAREVGARFVEDGAEPAIAVGAGTIGLELHAQASGLDALIVPLGNGALLAGVGAAFRHMDPQVEIVAVVAEQAPAMRLSLLAGRAIETARADTIADGIAVRVPVPAALEMLDGSLRHRRHGVRWADPAGRTDGRRVSGLVIEPAGAAGLAAIVAAGDRYRGRKVATILCGGNIAPGLRDQLVARSGARGEVLTSDFAHKFAAEWIAAWNSHDLERILKLYADDVEMVSPLIVERTGEASGSLRGRESVAAYWKARLAASPPLRFKLSTCSRVWGA